MFKLTGGSWEYRDLSFEDAAKLMTRDKAHTKEMQFRQAEVHARFSRSQAELGRAAKAARPGRLTKADISKGKSNAKAARQEERAERISSLPRSGSGDAPRVVIDATRAFEQQQERAAAKRDILGEEGMLAWLAKGSGDEPA